MGRKNIWLAASAALAAMIGLQGAALGQASKPAPAPAKTTNSVGTTESDVIVVTAQKKSEDLQTVPVAVSAFGAKDADKLGIKTVNDLTNFVPGVAYLAGADRFYVRGVGRSSNQASTDGDTAIYQDDVYTVSSTAAANPSILYPEREVLRGPQTTLYGHNSLGGALLINNRRPDSVQTEEARVQYGAFQRWETGLRFSGPVPGTEWLRYSLTGDYWNQGQGYFTNLAGLKDEGLNGHLGLLDGQLSADVGSNASAWLRVRKTGYDYSGRNAVNNGPNETTFGVFGAIEPNAAWAAIPGNALNVVTTNGKAPIQQNPTFATGDQRSFVSSFEGHNKLTDEYDIASEFSWNLGNTNLKYIGGMQTSDYFANSDYGGSGGGGGTNIISYKVPVTTNFNPALNNPTCTNALAIPCATLGGSFPQLYEEKRNWFSHEVDWSSKGDAPLQWLTGLYYYHETATIPLNFLAGGDEGKALQSNILNLSFAPAPSQPIPSNYFLYASSKTRTEAAFGQVDYKFNDHWKATTGLRYTQDTKSVTEQSREICWGVAACDGGFGTLSAQSLGALTPGLDITPLVYSSTLTTSYPGVVPVSSTKFASIDPKTGVIRRDMKDFFSAVTGSFAVNWTPNENTLGYARFDKAFKSGEFNAGLLGGFPEVGPESLNAYEVGLKARPVDKLQTNVSLFYYDWIGRQTPLTLQPHTTANPTNTPTLVFFNVPKSKSEGAELETIYRPFTDAHIIANISYLNAQITEGGPLALDGATGTLKDITGNTLPLSAKERYTVGVDYTFRGDWGSLFVGGNYAWRSHSFTDVFGDAINKVPSYGTLGLNAIWTESRGRFSVVASGTNVLDDVSYESVGFGKNYGPPGSASAQSTALTGPFQSQNFSLNPPRIWSVEVRAKF